MLPFLPPQLPTLSLPPGGGNDSPGSGDDYSGGGGGNNERIAPNGNDRGGGGLGSYTFEYPFSELIIWAVLTKRKEMAKLMWQHGNHILNLKSVHKIQNIPCIW